MMREEHDFMQKIVGSMLILFAGTWIGFLKGNELEERIHHMREMRHIFTALRQEIAYTRLPLCDAFSRVADRYPGIFGSWLLTMKDKLLEREEENFQRMWEHVTRQCLSESKLSHNDMELLTRQGAYMGQCDIGTQTTTMDLFLEQWEERILIANSQLANKRKLARCIGVLGSVLVVILLL